MSANSSFDAIRAFLKSIGYLETMEEGVCTFEHPEKIWIAASEENGGVMLTTAFKGADDYDPNDPTLLSILNMLNQDALASTFIALDEYTVCKAWYYGEFSQQSIQNFYALWENDINLFLSGMEEGDEEEGQE